MFEALRPSPDDPLLRLIKLYAADPRVQKIDLGVGVYQDEVGGTPVFRAVKAAERRLTESQDSKAYIGPEGDLGFCDLVKPIIFGPLADRPMVRLQTPGGTGAVRLACELLAAAGTKRVLLGVPSWPIHEPAIRKTGMEPVTFPHADLASQTADLGALMQAIGNAARGDAVILHGCCHNPTGIDYSPEDWAEIARALASHGLIPLIDLAYEGLGRGFEEDAAGLRTVVGAVPEALVAFSGDKNFGVYRDRLGALFALSDPQNLPSMDGALLHLARITWSMPPDHPAAAARIILSDPVLSAEWRDEVASMRGRLREMRDGLAQYQRIGDIDLAAVGRQNGLFSVLALSPEQIMRLREEFAVYLAPSGRINIAGLNRTNLPRFVESLRAVSS